VLFTFRIDIFVAHFAHTCLLFRSQFQFSIGIRAWYTLRRLNFLSVISLTSIMSNLSMHKVASVSYDISVHRTMFIKPIMSHTQSICGSKGVNQSIPTCHHYGVAGHIRPNCFQIRPQKPRNKTLAPRKDEPGFEEQVKMLSDQVKLISEKLAYLTPNEQRSVLVNNHKKTSKQVWDKKEDNMCLVSHTVLKILDTYLWYLDCGCSKHMTGNKTLLKEVQMGKGGRITYGDGSQSKVIGKGIIDIPGLGTSQEALYVEELKANLLSISQFCDNDLVVQFSKKECNIFDNSGRWLMGGERTAYNCYGLPGLATDPLIFCNKTTIDDSELWHQRLGHLNFSDMLKIAGKDIVKGLPKMENTGKGICGSCKLGKQTRAAHKKTSGIHTSKNLELLHMDLMGPTRTASLGGKRYILVIVDDFSRYAWVVPIREKYDVFDAAQHLFKKIQVEQNCQIMRIHSDHGREFEEFCLSFGIKQEFSSPITPQQNGVVERKNRVIQEMARVMIHSKNLAQHLWGEAVNTACHIIKMVYLRPETSKIPMKCGEVRSPQ
jgi:hypothetical protein